MKKIYLLSLLLVMFLGFSSSVQEIRAGVTATTASPVRVNYLLLNKAEFIEALSTTYSWENSNTYRVYQIYELSTGKIINIHPQDYYLYNDNEHVFWIEFYRR